MYRKKRGIEEDCPNKKAYYVLLRLKCQKFSPIYDSSIISVLDYYMVRIY